jgi:hypothetical protein
LRQRRFSPACRGHSRLMRVHRRDGDRVVTQDILWWEGRVEKGADSVKDAEHFCQR